MRSRTMYAMLHLAHKFAIVFHSHTVRNQRRVLRGRDGASDADADARRLRARRHRLQQDVRALLEGRHQEGRQRRQRARAARQGRQVLRQGACVCARAPCQILLEKCQVTWTAPKFFKVCLGHQSVQ